MKSSNATRQSAEGLQELPRLIPLPGGRALDEEDIKKRRHLRHQSLWYRRWVVFRKQKRAVIAGVLLLLASFFSLTAEIWSNNKPLVMRYQGETYFPAFQDYHPRDFGIEDSLVVDYAALKTGAEDWALWPVNRWNPYQSNKTAETFPAPPSTTNWLGIDDRGRDVFARLLYGLRYSLVFAVLVWAFCSAIALAFGGISGYRGGWTDLLGQRALEVLSTIPQLLLLIFLISIFEPSLFLLVLVSCIFGWIGLSYYVRGEVLKSRKLDFVEAARACGASEWRIISKHILPNSLVPVITFAPFMIVANISGLAVLDYLGFGLPAPTPSWGELLQQAQNYFSWAWWLAAFPALALFVTLLCLALLGDGIRVAFDPRKAQ